MPDTQATVIKELELVELPSMTLDNSHQTPLLVEEQECDQPLIPLQAPASQVQDQHQDEYEYNCSHLFLVLVNCGPDRI